MEAEVLERIQNMKLTMDEDEVVSIRVVKRDKILDEFSLSLLGRFLTPKPINLRAAKNTLRLMWKLGDDMKIIEVREGLLQFKFSMESQLISVTFTKQPLWIQVWGLPFDLINEDAGIDIGRSIGELVELDCKSFNLNQARFLQIQVEVPLDKPLQRGGPVISPEGEMTCVAF
nr:hypothetical protein CFP56_59888 [Quercus suber]